MNIILTGGTDGIGFSAVKLFLEKGHSLHLTYRSINKLKRVQTYIESKNLSHLVYFYKCDISEPSEIHHFISELSKRKIFFDCLINNAGVILFEKSFNSIGLEKVFAVNHIGGFYLTKLLLDKKLINKNSKIINVGSSAHQKATLDFDDLDSKKTRNWYTRYSRSKLCNLLFTFELAKRLKKKGITVNCMHPGIVSTNIAQERIGLMQFIIKIVLKIKGISPTEGADTIIFLATDKSVSQISGKYFVKRKLCKPSAVAKNNKYALQLWKESESIVKEFKF
tara:strand:- start:3283 stop:4122 length:840 start_codon:yes stop_codon:yes gene_type:complete